VGQGLERGAEVLAFRYDSGGRWTSERCLVGGQGSSRDTGRGGAGAAASGSGAISLRNASGAGCGELVLATGLPPDVPAWPRRAGTMLGSWS
jgi:hypothetical protein